MSSETYAELLKLEEEQLNLERRLQEQKRAAMRQHLIRTIEENKVKIAKKKEDLREQKLREREQSQQQQALLEREAQLAQVEKVERKQKTKEEMLLHLKMQQKKAEDQ